ncbi:PREDICTED: uncharacterized protein LOC106811369 [Priapulus caudatus]|uniref:Uncharacterized protein LOC106811369 n=1 Tax=Priapulus caudatus TaxID=37621 RepID=A0ABM1EE21_PRICU|nr:PREDICTED: uncharacterized protein LOC106811369 [Priapulus caudatus]
MDTGWGSSLLDPTRDSEAGRFGALRPPVPNGREIRTPETRAVVSPRSGTPCSADTDNAGRRAVAENAVSENPMSTVVPVTARRILDILSRRGDDTHPATNRQSKRGDATCATDEPLWRASSRQDAACSGGREFDAAPATPRPVEVFLDDDDSVEAAKQLIITALASSATCSHGGYNDDDFQPPQTPLPEKRFLNDEESDAAIATLKLTMTRARGASSRAEADDVVLTTTQCGNTEAMQSARDKIRLTSGTADAGEIPGTANTRYVGDTPDVSAPSAGDTPVVMDSLSVRETPGLGYNNNVSEQASVSDLPEAGSDDHQSMLGSNCNQPDPTNDDDILNKKDLRGTCNNNMPNKSNDNDLLEKRNNELPDKRNANNIPDKCNNDGLPDRVRNHDLPERRNNDVLASSDASGHVGSRDSGSSASEADSPRGDVEYLDDTGSVDAVRRIDSALVAMKLTMTASPHASSPSDCLAGGRAQVKGGRPPQRSEDDALGVHTPHEQTSVASVHASRGTEGKEEEREKEGKGKEILPIGATSEAGESSMESSPPPVMQQYPMLAPAMKRSPMPALVTKQTPTPPANVKHSAAPPAVSQCSSPPLTIEPPPTPQPVVRFLDDDDDEEAMQLLNEALGRERPRRDDVAATMEQSASAAGPASCSDEAEAPPGRASADEQAEVVVRNLEGNVVYKLNDGSDSAPRGCEVTQDEVANDNVPQSPPWQVQFLEGSEGSSAVDYIRKGLGAEKAAAVAVDASVTSRVITSLSTVATLTTTTPTVAKKTRNLLSIANRLAHQQTGDGSTAAPTDDHTGVPLHLSVRGEANRFMRQGMGRHKAARHVVGSADVLAEIREYAERANREHQEVVTGSSVPEKSSAAPPTDQPPSQQRGDDRTVRNRFGAMPHEETLRRNDADVVAPPAQQRGAEPRYASQRSDVHHSMSAYKSVDVELRIPDPKAIFSREEAPAAPRAAPFSQLSPLVQQPHRRLDTSWFSRRSPQMQGAHMARMPPHAAPGFLPSPQQSPAAPHPHVAAMSFRNALPRAGASTVVQTMPAPRQGEFRPTMGHPTMLHHEGGRSWPRQAGAPLAGSKAAGADWQRDLQQLQEHERMWGHGMLPQHALQQRQLQQQRVLSQAPHREMAPRGVSQPFLSSPPLYEDVMQQTIGASQYQPRAPPFPGHPATFLPSSSGGTGRPPVYQQQQRAAAAPPGRGAFEPRSLRPAAASLGPPRQPPPLVPRGGAGQNPARPPPQLYTPMGAPAVKPPASAAAAAGGGISHQHPRDVLPAVDLSSRSRRPVEVLDLSLRRSPESSSLRGDVIPDSSLRRDVGPESSLQRDVGSCQTSESSEIGEKIGATDLRWQTPRPHAHELPAEHQRTTATSLHKQQRSLVDERPLVDELPLGDERPLEVGGGYLAEEFAKEHGEASSAQLSATENAELFISRIMSKAVDDIMNISTPGSPRSPDAGRRARPTRQGGGVAPDGSMPCQLLNLRRRELQCMQCEVRYPVMMARGANNYIHSYTCAAAKVPRLTPKYFQCDRCGMEFVTINPEELLAHDDVCIMATAPPPPAAPTVTATGVSTPPPQEASPASSIETIPYADDVEMSRSPEGAGDSSPDVIKIIEDQASGMMTACAVDAQREQPPIKIVIKPYADKAGHYLQTSGSEVATVVRPLDQLLCRPCSVRLQRRPLPATLIVAADPDYAEEPPSPASSASWQGSEEGDSMGASASDSLEFSSSSDAYSATDEDEGTQRGEGREPADKKAQSAEQMRQERHEKQARRLALNRLREERRKRASKAAHARDDDDDDDDDDEGASSGSGSRYHARLDEKSLVITLKPCSVPFPPKPTAPPTGDTPLRRPGLPRNTARKGHAAPSLSVARRQQPHAPKQITTTPDNDSQPTPHDETSKAKSADATATVATGNAQQPLEVLLAQLLQGPEQDSASEMALSMPTAELPHVVASSVSRVSDAVAETTETTLVTHAANVSSASRALPARKKKKRRSTNRVYFGSRGRRKRRKAVADAKTASPAAQQLDAASQQLPLMPAARGQSRRRATLSEQATKPALEASSGAVAKLRVRRSPGRPPRARRQHAKMGVYCVDAGAATSTSELMDASTFTDTTLAVDAARVTLTADKGRPTVATDDGRVTDDGRATVAIDDGRVTVAGNNGRIVVSEDDDRATVAVDDGRVTVAGNNGRIVVSEDDDRATVAVDDSRSTIAGNNGRIVVSEDDDRATVAVDDGRVTVAVDDGRIVVSEDDDRATIAVDDGKVTVAGNNGRIVVSEDDDRATVAVDDGRVTVSEENGRIAINDDDGGKVNVVNDDRLTVAGDDAQHQPQTSPADSYGLLVSGDVVSVGDCASSVVDPVVADVETSLPALETLTHEATDDWCNSSTHPDAHVKAVADISQTASLSTCAGEEGTSGNDPLLIGKATAVSPPITRRTEDLILSEDPPEDVLVVPSTSVLSPAVTDKSPDSSGTEMQDVVEVKDEVMQNSADLLPGGVESVREGQDEVTPDSADVLEGGADSPCEIGDQDALNIMVASPKLEVEFSPGGASAGEASDDNFDKTSVVFAASKQEELRRSPAAKRNLWRCIERFMVATGREKGSGHHSEPDTAETNAEQPQMDGGTRDVDKPQMDGGTRGEVNVDQPQMDGGRRDKSDVYKPLIDIGTGSTTGKVEQPTAVCSLPVSLGPTESPVVEASHDSEALRGGKRKVVRLADRIGTSPELATMAPFNQHLTDCKSMTVDVSTETVTELRQDDGKDEVSSGSHPQEGPECAQIDNAADPNSARLPSKIDSMDEAGTAGIEGEAATGNESPTSTDSDPVDLPSLHMLLSPKKSQPDIKPVFQHIQVATSLTVQPTASTQAPKPAMPQCVNTAMPQSRRSTASPSHQPTMPQVLKPTASSQTLGPTIPQDLKPTVLRSTDSMGATPQVIRLIIPQHFRSTTSQTIRFPTSQNVLLTMSQSVKPAVSQSVGTAVSHTVKPEISQSVGTAVSHTVKPAISQSVVPAVSHSVKPAVSQSVVPAVSHIVRLVVSQSARPAVSHVASSTQTPRVVMSRSMQPTVPLANQAVVSSCKPTRDSVARNDSTVQRAPHLPPRMARKTMRNGPTEARQKQQIAARLSCQQVSPPALRQGISGCRTSPDSGWARLQPAASSNDTTNLRGELTTPTKNRRGRPRKEPETSAPELKQGSSALRRTTPRRAASRQASTTLSRTPPALRRVSPARRHGSPTLRSGSPTLRSISPLLRYGSSPLRRASPSISENSQGETTQLKTYTRIPRRLSAVAAQPITIASVTADDTTPPVTVATVTADQAATATAAKPSESLLHPFKRRITRSTSRESYPAAVAADDDGDSDLNLPDNFQLTNFFTRGRSCSVSPAVSDAGAVASRAVGRMSPRLVAMRSPGSDGVSPSTAAVSPYRNTRSACAADPVSTPSDDRTSGRPRLASPVAANSQRAAVRGKRVAKVAANVENPKRIKMELQASGSRGRAVARVGLRSSTPTQTASPIEKTRRGLAILIPERKRLHVQGQEQEEEEEEKERPSLFGSMKKHFTSAYTQANKR